jgi:IS30 family transposase
MKRKRLHNGTHLIKNQHEAIQVGIENGFAKADIVRTIGKDATTVEKEIRRHRLLKPRNTFDHLILCAKPAKCSKNVIRSASAFTTSIFIAYPWPTSRTAEN